MGFCGNTGTAVALAAALAFASAPVSAVQPAKSGDLAIVVNASTPVSSLTFAELRQIFRGDRQYWTKDLPVVVLLRAPAAAERDAVLKSIYEMTEPQFKQFWIAKIFRAETSSPPKLVYSGDMTAQLVASIDGAIAFIAASEVRPPLKVLKIDGLLPGERGYRLHLK